MIFTRYNDFTYIWYDCTISYHLFTLLKWYAFDVGCWIFSTYNEFNICDHMHIIYGGILKLKFYVTSFSTTHYIYSIGLNTENANILWILCIVYIKYTVNQLFIVFRWIWHLDRHKGIRLHLHLVRIRIKTSNQAVELLCSSILTINKNRFETFACFLLTLNANIIICNRSRKEQIYNFICYFRMNTQNFSKFLNFLWLKK